MVFREFDTRFEFEALQPERARQFEGPGEKPFTDPVRLQSGLDRDLADVKKLRTIERPAEHAADEL